MPRPSSPVLRVITDPEAVALLASHRQAWAELWQAIAREDNADHLDETREDKEASAESAESAAKAIARHLEGSWPGDRESEQK